MPARVYRPGAAIGIRLRAHCNCPCHQGRTRHAFPCCTAVDDFEDFPELDADGRPVAKLPPCPYCAEDELGVIHRGAVLCYRCGWKLVKE